MEIIKNLDFFSQSFQFSQGKRALKKRTLFGALLSILIVTITLSYLVNLFNQYANNKIEPKFRSQTFATDDDVQIPFVNELVGLQYITKKNSTFDNLDQIEKQTNKTYIVYVPLYVYQINSKTVYRQVLDLVPCQNPQISGNKCIDLSKLPSNSTFTGGIRNKINTAISILAYRCQDTDPYKTTVPSNCASPSEIDNFINNSNNNLYAFLHTSQYNITSNEIQENYYKYPLILTTSQMVFTTYSAQKQITSVLSGAILQSEFSFSSAISYSTTTQSFDYATTSKSLNLKCFAKFSVQISNQVQYIKIQYTTIPELLAMCNSIFAVMMCLGFFGRYIAQQLIRQDLFLLILKNMYSESYEKLLNINKFLSQQKIELINRDIECPAESVDCNQKETEQKDIFTNSPVLESKSPLQHYIKYDNIQQKPIRDEVIEDILIIQTQEQVQNYTDDSSKLQKSNEYFYNKLNQNSPKQICVSPLMNFKSKDSSNQNCNSQESQIVQSLNPFSNKTQKKYLIPQKQKVVQEIQKDEQICESEMQQSEVEQSQIKKYYEERIKAFKSKLYSSKITNQLFQFRLRRKNDKIKSNQLNPQTKIIIEKQVDNCLDFCEIYKEIIFLKKAVMTILSKDQYAALSLVGFSDNLPAYIQNLNGQPQQKQNVENLNHYEELQTLSMSDELQTQEIIKFLLKCKFKQNLSTYDERIFSSISKKISN
ncbi:AMP-binding enzyme family protein (macronuclear) [Tetrahymena thermophila SB210]|uniref:AMP-binding enzyme family protein n=1 Tax=Tetrahymena thermophila (strain SB210) TaxID=312017 RepID=I7LY35_TETTS|nr:AMP-binding enzyme family protein [Tetrahymena thermophila SB210]EAS07585.2 AMP-binding enzyme family protein [Tetrahymena thermophila SB210]|eukprot:XP_001027827.2 AMP-binding enzyme family protein [Tetrahymena thermophila SB210]